MQTGMLLLGQVAQNVNKLLKKLINFLAELADVFIAKLFIIYVGYPFLKPSIILLNIKSTKRTIET